MLAKTDGFSTPCRFTFLDTETSGLAVRDGFDQVLQFAAITTDAAFNIVDPDRDVLNVRARRLPWITPSPSAMLVTGVTPDQLERSPLSHHQMMTKVVAFLEDQMPTTFVAHNWPFDNAAIRNAAWSTLHPPYLTSNPSCNVLDTLGVLKAINALDPGKSFCRTSTASHR